MFYIIVHLLPRNFLMSSFLFLSLPLIPANLRSYPISGTETIFDRFWDIKPEIYPGHDVDLSGHMTSSVTWQIDSLYTISHRCAFGTKTRSPTDFEILRHKYIWVTTLTFPGHVTSLVTGPFHSQYLISYRCSIDIDPLSWTVFEILSLKYIRVTTLTFRVTWRHRSRDKSIRYIYYFK